MPDSRQSVQSAVWTVPAALETIPVALQDAALCRKSVRLSGIVSECRQYEDQTVLKLKHIAISGMETGAVLPGNLSEESCICYLEKTTVPQIGSFVIVEGVPDAFSGARNPGEFDYVRYYLGQGISFRLKDAVLISSSKSRMPYREALSRVRRYACGIFERYLDAQDAGVLSAMLLGEKTGLAKELRSLYAQSGIAHILAISGVKMLSLVSPYPLKKPVNWAFMRLHIAESYIISEGFSRRISSHCPSWDRGDKSLENNLAKVSIISQKLYCSAKEK